MKDWSAEDQKTFQDADGKAEYGKCVDISTKAALREMVLPGVMAIAAPVIIAFMPGFGVESLGGGLQLIKPKEPTGTHTFLFGPIVDTTHIIVTGFDWKSWAWQQANVKEAQNWKPHVRIFKDRGETCTPSLLLGLRHLVAILVARNRCYALFINILSGLTSISHLACLASSPFMIWLTNFASVGNRLGLD